MLDPLELSHGRILASAARAGIGADYGLLARGTTETGFSLALRPRAP